MVPRTPLFRIYLHEKYKIGAPDEVHECSMRIRRSTLQFPFLHVREESRHTVKVMIRFKIQKFTHEMQIACDFSYITKKKHVNYQATNSIYQFCFRFAYQCSIFLVSRWCRMLESAKITIGKYLRRFRKMNPSIINQVSTESYFPLIHMVRIRPAWMLPSHDYRLLCGCIFIYVRQDTRFRIKQRFEPH